jgi:hypothetical protein
MHQPIRPRQTPSERSVQTGTIKGPPRTEVELGALHRHSRPGGNHAISVERQHSRSRQRQPTRIGRSMTSPRIRMRPHPKRSSNIPNILDPMRNRQPTIIQRIGNSDPQSSRPPSLRLNQSLQRHQRPGVLQHRPRPPPNQPVNSIPAGRLSDLQLLPNPVQHPRSPSSPVRPRHQHGPSAHRRLLIGTERLHIRNAVHLERPQARAYSRDHSGGTLVRDPQHEAEAYGANGRTTP